MPGNIEAKIYAELQGEEVKVARQLLKQLLKVSLRAVEELAGEEGYLQSCCASV